MFWRFARGVDEQERRRKACIILRPIQRLLLACRRGGAQSRSPGRNGAAGALEPARRAYDVHERIARGGHGGDGPLWRRASRNNRVDRQHRPADRPARSRRLRRSAGRGRRRASRLAGRSGRRQDATILARRGPPHATTVLRALSIHPATCPARGMSCCSAGTLHMRRRSALPDPRRPARHPCYIVSTLVATASTSFASRAWPGKRGSKAGTLAKEKGGRLAPTSLFNSAMRPWLTGRRPARRSLPRDGSAPRERRRRCPRAGGSRRTPAS